MNRDEAIGQKVAASIAGDFLDPRDPWGHAQLEIIRQLCMAFDHAMNLEDIDHKIRFRVINQVLFGDPDGIEDRHRQSLDALKEFAATATLPDLTNLLEMPR